MENIIQKPESMKTIFQLLKKSGADLKYERLILNFYEAQTIEI